MDNRRRRRRNMRRVRQRNRRVLLVVGLTCFIIWAGITNINKAKAAEEAAYAKQQEQEAKEKEASEKEQEEKLTLAAESEKDEWYLKLVNADNPITEDDVPEVVTETLDNNGYQVDTRIVDAMEKMFQDAYNAGKSPIIVSAFRSWDTQTYLHENKIERVMNEEGLDREDAVIKASTVVAKPGTSEHQIGLALDIVSSEYTNLDEKQMETEDQKWLMENSWKYGFILRYPLDKSDITGVIFEPWHYRYVGEKAAKEITEQGITLEEYLGADAVSIPVFEEE